jgi:hypothetical protein
MFFLIMAFLATVPAHAVDKLATTDDGKRVILKDDGTWRYHIERDKIARQMLNPSSPAGSEETDILAPQKPKVKSLVEIIQSDTRYDFRNARWGMTAAEVKSSESARLLSQNAEKLEYDMELLGYTSRVTYFFVNDRLYKATYALQQPHVDPARYYKDFEALKEQVRPVYGAPVTDIYDWKNEMYRNDRSKWGFAISIGFLTCSTIWKNSATLVSLKISGSNHQISTNLEYSSMKK